MKSKKILKTATYISPDGKPYVVEMMSGFVPKVTLVSHTQSPTHLMAQIANGYNGIYESHILPEDVPQLIEDIKNTALRTPMEMVQLTWLIQDVTRAFTHQAVRYRVGASYVQESMRFWGERERYGFFAPPTIVRDEDALMEYWKSCLAGILGYVKMRELGIPDQDCRGSLPTNILTQMFMTVTLSTQAHLINTRWCCQAQQSEWMPVMLQMRKQLHEVGLDQFMNPPIEAGKPCGFNASFDRPCFWKDRTLQEIEEGL